MRLGFLLAISLLLFPTGIYADYWPPILPMVIDNLLSSTNDSIDRNCSTKIYYLFPGNVKYENILFDDLEARPGLGLGEYHPGLNCSNPDGINQSISEWIWRAKLKNKTIAYPHPDFYERPSDFCGSVWLNSSNLQISIMPTRGYIEFRVPIQGA